MQNRFKIALLLLPFVAFLSFLPCTTHGAPFGSTLLPERTKEPAPELSIKVESESSISFSWTWGGYQQPPYYTVTVTDLTTSTVVNTFVTSTQSGAASRLKSEHTYLVSVNGNGIIIDEIIVIMD